MPPQDDGGPAFPHHLESTDEDGYTDLYSHDGMSLRDYFAGQALYSAFSEVMLRMGEGDLSGFGWDGVANDAYRIADAMLAARKEGA